MRLLLFPILILGQLVASIAWAAPCEINQVKDRFGNPRIVKMEFADGRRITMVGQQHTDRNEMWRMLNLPEGEELFSNVRVFVNSPSSREALPLFAEERKLLYDAVVKDGAKFIGIELEDGRVPVWLSKVRELQERMLAHSAHTGESDIELISKARLAAYGAVLAMPLEQPALFLKARLYGIEDKDAVNFQAQAALKLEQATEEMLRELNGNKELISKLSDLNTDMQLEQYTHFEPSVPGMSAMIINPQLSKWPGMYRKTLRKYLETYIGFFSTLYVRDELSTKNILAQNQSGIVFIGGAHVRPIMRRLKIACLEDLRREEVTSSITSQVVR